MSTPSALDADPAGNIFACVGGDGIVKYSNTGTVLGSVYVGDYVVEVASDASGDAFVSTTSHEIIKYSNALGLLTFWGGFGSGNGQFFQVRGIGSDPSGNVYAADTGNNRIQKFTNSGTFLTSWGSSGSGNGQFQGVYDVAADAAGNVYTVEALGNRVQKFSSSGVYMTQWGGFGTGNGQFDAPTRIHVDAAGNVYVADAGNDRIQKFTSNGAFLCSWGPSAGPGQLSNPVSVTTDATGTIYVADYGHSRYAKYRSPATIAFVSDVRNDQGRQVRLRVLRASGDAAGSGVTIPRYDVFRRIDPLPAPSTTDDLVAPASVDLAGWDQVGTFSAYGESEYNIVVPTLADATAASLEYSAYMVRAATDNPLTFFDSGVVNGYSVDNLAPGTPAPFVAAYSAGATHLHWGRSAASDFDFFRLYRGASADFVPNSGSLIATPPDTGYADPGLAGSWYKLTAVDWNGNESPYAVVGPGQTVDSPSTAVAFALDGVRPSPAVGGRVVVHFALPSAAPATVELIDVTGRRVRSRDVGSLGVGRHAVDLTEGERVPPGVWFIRLSQAEKEAVVRAVVVE